MCVYVHMYGFVRKNPYFIRFQKDYQYKREKKSENLQFLHEVFPDPIIWDIFSLFRQT